MSATALTVHFLAAQLLNHPIKKNVIFSQQSCVDEDFKNCIPPFKKFDNKYRTAEKFKLGACVIEKSMSTLLAAMMCLLHDEISFREANRSLTTDMWENRFVYLINYLEFSFNQFFTDFAKKKMNSILWKVFF